MQKLRTAFSNGFVFIIQRSRVDPRPSVVNLYVMDLICNSLPPIFLIAVTQDIKNRFSFKAAFFRDVCGVLYLAAGGYCQKQCENYQQNREGSYQYLFHKT